MRNEMVFLIDFKFEKIGLEISVEKAAKIDAIVMLL